MHFTVLTKSNFFKKRTVRDGLTLGGDLRINILVIGTNESAKAGTVFLSVDRTQIRAPAPLSTTFTRIGPTSSRVYRPLLCGWHSVPGVNGRGLMALATNLTPVKKRTDKSFFKTFKI